MRDSHIIPKFFFKWIKRTSATGYLRFAKEPNVRVQDGKKDYLLCQDCEKHLSKFETYFSNNIFYPYVNYELDDFGIAKGVIKSFEYDNRLLKFIISMQWRLLISEANGIEKLKDEFKDIINSKIKEWREFILNTDGYNGEEETHMLFLQNLIAAKGDLPDKINDNINFYILRSCDGTIIFSIDKLAIYSKIGPIVFVTSLVPKNLDGMQNTKVDNNGSIKTAQILQNYKLNQFLFIDRPNLASSDFKLSEIQYKKISNQWLKNPEKAANSMTMKATYSDILLKRRK